MNTSDYTDQYGVTYSADGKTLKSIDHERFLCEEYTVPEGVEVIECEFGGTRHAKMLHAIHLPSTLRQMEGNTFLGCSIEEIELPYGMTEVPASMCEHCECLRKVALPETIRRIDIGAFCGCTNLSEINLPDSIVHISDNVFQYCTSLKHISIPPKMKYLCADVLECSGIESLEIPPNITEIGYYALLACPNLKSLVIPETVKVIDFGIVTASEVFEGLECHAKGYHVENDALIDDKCHELLCCWTRQKHYIVPECVTKIADISCNDFIETITIRQNIELTQPGTFACNSNMEHIYFQGKVSGLNNSTFYMCPRLKNNI